MEIICELNADSIILKWKLVTEIKKDIQIILLFKHF